MKKIFLFLVKLGREAIDNELYYIGNELTYKILLSIFPLIICVISLLNLVNLDISGFDSLATSAIPEEVKNSMSAILDSISYNAPVAINAVVFSLIFAIFSASSGFVSIIRGINKTYAVKDERSFVFRRILSLFLVVMFLFSIILSLVLLIFGNVILDFIFRIGIIGYFNSQLYALLSYLFTGAFVLFNVMIIYKFSSYKKISFKSTIPGAITTLLSWGILSKLFNIYISNFSSYNNIYGSIGSFIIFVLWLNIIAIALLVGSQINAILSESKV